MIDDIWSDLFGGLGDMDRMMEEAFGRLGGRARGYAMWQGPDGVRHVREFGGPGISEPGLREPFADVSDDGDVVRAVLEIPGVTKEDVEIVCNGSSLKVSASTPGREFTKELALPCEVDVSSAKAECNNGLLEVTLAKAAPACEGTRIEIS